MRVQTVSTAKPKKKRSQFELNFMTYAKRYCGAKLIRTRGGKMVEGEWRPNMAWDFSGASNLDELQSVLKSSVMIRRLKSEVLHDLPPKRHQIIVLRSNDDDSDLIGQIDESWDYDKTVAYLTSHKPLFTEWSKRRRQQGMNKAIQIFDHIVLSIENGSDKIICFCHHYDVLEMLEYYCLESNIGYVSVTGNMTTSARQDAVDVFNDDPNCKVIFGTIGAMGVGFTMTISDHVIFAELDPVPGRMSQAEDRAHRIGQDRSVLIQHLVLDKTIDAHIAKLLVRKQEVINAALDK
jgi:SWI/SNF-related matrix-associated actin-dependent regulator 1 of chromatin subfamily A